MTTRQRFQRVAELFLEAWRLDGPARDSFLDERCAGEPDLRSELLALLDADRLPQGALDRPVVCLDLSEPAPPDRVGRYRIIRPIGRGGMGAVYEAEQEHPRRIVALKVINAGITAPQALRRLEHEAEVLGRLQHPGIAQVFEAGSFDAGAGAQPYFAMELIRGEPLTHYAETHRLGTRERLALVARICDAVQHAHERGVIHRDLKPANILVDASGQPKILDFGIARVTDGDIQTTTLRTDIGQIIGTVAYMSPEQASGDPREIDTRSDVYALGVVAYELLAGRLPHDLKNKLVHEAVRTIREDDPTPLSSIDRVLRGDVATIVGKALAKDRARRYPSAAALAEDIRRHLQDEPITARPPSAMYQLSRFARRNKAFVGAAAAAFVIMAAAVVAVSLLAVSEARARRAAEDASAEADEARLAETAHRERAEREAEIARAASDFLTGMLNAANPWTGEAAGGPARDVKVVDVLDAATETVAASFAGQPEVEAHVRLTLGVTYRDLGEYDKAQPHLERARELFGETLGEQGRDTIEALREIGTLHRLRGRLEEAEAAHLAALEAARRALGEDDEDTLHAMNSLAILYRETDQPDKAERLHLEALASRRERLGEDHELTLQTKNNLALLYSQLRRFDESEPLSVEVYEAFGRQKGEEDPATLTAMNNLGLLYYRQGRFGEAESLHRQCLELRRRAFGDEHPTTLTVMNNLAQDLSRSAPDEAEQLWLKVLAVQERTLGEDHQHTVITLGSLGRLYLRNGDAGRAEPYMRRALEAWRRSVGDDDRRTIRAMGDLAEVYAMLARYEEAEALALSCHERMLARFGPDDSNTRRSVEILAELYDRWGRPEAAARWRAALPQQN